MSFFRNLRSSITRGRSSSRDTTPVRGSTTITTTTTHSSRTGSISSGATGGRRDSVDSRTDSLFNRSDTFILGEDELPEEKNHSNTSTLEKKSKKSKVLSKFSTFTKRKKTPSPESIASYEHHPSDNATNTYYKWKSESGPANVDYDAQSDPFNFLYEKPSSLRNMQSGMPTSAGFDSSTYRKGKMPTQLKERLEQLKAHNAPEVYEEEPELEGDKYKTITLNSFRKSFREKFLQQQHEAPHNPAWFVEVEETSTGKKEKDAAQQAKENRPDFLVFKNENYRPGSRSPVRDRPSRSTARSPVKRNETFRVERPSMERPIVDSTTDRTLTETPSIRIEIKNSITPHMPGRIVPVGVAKPILSHYTSPSDNATRQNNNSTVRPWSKPVGRITSPTRNTSGVNRSGRFQTLVQIRNEANSVTAKPLTNTQTRGRLPPTRVQLGGASPSTQKRLNSVGSRYSISTPLASYELLRHPNASLATDTRNNNNTNNKAMKGKQQTYFGEQDTPRHFPVAKHTGNGKTTAYSWTNNNNNHHNNNNNITTTTTTTTTSKLYQPTRSSFAAHSGSVAVNSGNSNNNNNNTNYYNRREPRVVVPMQRRSRSPIKMPWR